MILMSDFNAEPPDLREAMLAGVQRVINSGWYILGKEFEQLLRMWAKACRVEYGVGVGNGLDAIESVTISCKCSTLCFAKNQSPVAGASLWSNTEYVGMA